MPSAKNPTIRGKPMPVPITQLQTSKATTSRRSAARGLNISPTYTPILSTRHISPLTYRSNTATPTKGRENYKINNLNDSGDSEHSQEAAGRIVKHEKLTMAQKEIEQKRNRVKNLINEEKKTLESQRTEKMIRRRKTDEKIFGKNGKVEKKILANKKNASFDLEKKRIGDFDDFKAKLGEMLKAIEMLSD
jgi:hypothetical protein